MKKSAVLFVLLSVMKGEAIAQQADCGLVLTRGLREYDVQSKSAVFLNSTFQNYCSASGETKSSSLSAGIDIIAKAIPISFTLGSQDSRTAMSNFCKTYKSDTSNVSESSRYQAKIVERAYKSFDSCVALSLNGNVVTHDVITIEHVQVYLRAGIDRPVELRGVKTSGNIACSGSSGGKQVNYNEATAAKTGSSMTINCIRTPRKSEDGQLIYDEGSAAFDIALGKYSIFFPRDFKLPEDKASIISTTVSGLRLDIDALKTRKVKVDYNNCSYFQNKAADKNLGKDRVLGEWSSSGIKGRDIDPVEQCPADMALIGVSGGRGHSGTWNEPHGLKCCSLKME